MHYRSLGERSRASFLFLLTFLFALSLIAPVHAQTVSSITITLITPPDSLNPAFTYERSGLLIRDLIFSGAWTFDDKLNPVPLLAVQFPTLANGGVSKDGKVITIKLRPDAIWSDGQPISSDDFVFTANVYTNDNNHSILQRSPYDLAIPKQGPDANQVNVKAPDKNTVVITFNEVYAAWPATLFRAVLPAHILRPIFDKAHSLEGIDWNLHPTVSSGPFTLKNSDAGSLTFVRNDKYFGTKAKLDQIVIQIVPDAATQLAAVKVAVADMGTLLTAAEAADLRASGAPVQIMAVPGGYNEGLFLNFANPILADVKVRKALASAIDRVALIAFAQNGIAKPSAGFWDGTPYQDASLQPLAFDADGAGKMLDGAGWKVGSDGIREKNKVKLKLRFATNQRDFRTQAQTVLQSQFKAIGVDIEPTAYPNAVFFASYAAGGTLATGQFDIAEWSASPDYPDPATTRFLTSQIGTKENGFAGANVSHLSDPALDKLFETAAKTADAAARIKIFNQISKLMADKVYWIPLWQSADLWAINKRLMGVTIGGVSPWWNAASWTVG